MIFFWIYCFIDHKLARIKQQYGSFHWVIDFVIWKYKFVPRPACFNGRSPTSSTLSHWLCRPRTVPYHMWMTICKICFLTWCAHICWHLPAHKTATLIFLKVFAGQVLLRDFWCAANNFPSSLLLLDFDDTIAFALENMFLHGFCACGHQNYLKM